MVTLSKLCKCMCVYVSLACLLKPMLLQKGLLDLHLYKTTVEPLNKGHLSNEDIVCNPNHIELCTNLPLN